MRRFIDSMLLQGDCLQLMSDIPDGSVHLVICDPPYGTTNAKWDTPLDLGKMWEQYKRIIKPNGMEEAALGLNHLDSEVTIPQNEGFSQVKKMCRNAYNAGLRQGKKKRPRAIKP